MQNVGPRLVYSDQLHAEKYRLKGETFRDAMGRVASALKDSPEHYHSFRDSLLEMRFLPAGRIQSAVGSPKNVTPYNCFVSGKIPDSMTEPDNPEKSSIAHRAEQAAVTMRMGGGIGYNFSHLRPDGAIIKKLQSRSMGPLAFMPVFDAWCRATSSAGNRRGAQMGILNIDHPDISAFVHAKHKEGVLEGFNLSIGVKDDFMEALARKGTYDLKFQGEVYQTVDAEELWEQVMRSTWDWGEPGVFFIDRVNYWNNLWYCEEIEACNPCGEQPLGPFAACLLGSFNLVKYLRRDLGGFYFDWEQFAEDIKHAVRAVDNVIDRARYPLKEQEEQAKLKRRMGLGVTGEANAFEAMGMPYGSARYLAMEDKVHAFLTRHAYLASVELAKEKGSFPLFDAERYCEGKFIKTLDRDVQELIRKHGIRNSHLISIAPTGTISQTADNVSSSIEPIIQFQQKRYVFREGSRERVLTDLPDYGFAEFRVRGKRSLFGEVTAKEHVDVLITAQRHCDSAVSKTVNCDKTMPWDEFKGIYLTAYEGGAKGCTTFNKDGKRAGLFVVEPEAADLPFPVGPGAISTQEPGHDLIGGGMTCEFDPATGRRSCE